MLSPVQAVRCTAISVLLSLLGVYSASAQALQIRIPTEEYTVAEGDTFRLALRATADGDSVGIGNVRFALHRVPPNAGIDVRLDSAGQLVAVPGFGAATRTEPQRYVPVVVAAQDGRGRLATALIGFNVRQVNRAPRVGELVPGYARPGETFTYNLKSHVADDDGDALTFTTDEADLPEGASLSPDGTFKWSLSNAMARNLPQQITFSVSDGERTSSGAFEVRRSQAGLAPQVAILGDSGNLVLDEGKEATILLDVSDPNGTEDVVNVYPTTNIPHDAYAFTWPVDGNAQRAQFVLRPGYSFVPQGSSNRAFTINFQAVDRDGKRAEPVVLNATVNESPDPEVLYREYRSSLENATGALKQLLARQRTVEGRLRSVRRSERIRRVTSAVLGMTTAGFGIFATGKTQKLGAGVGGMLTTGISGLEAAKVFTSTEPLERDAQDTAAEVIRVRFEAEVLAREYSTAEKRKTPAFQQDRKTLDRVVLEARSKLKIADAPPAVSDEEIKQHTVYFAPR